MRSWGVSWACAGALILAGCSTGAGNDGDSVVHDTEQEANLDTPVDPTDVVDPTLSGADTATAPGTRRFRYPPAPDSPPADRAADDAAALIDRINERLTDQSFDYVAVAELARAGDPRHAWYVVDLLRFFGGDEGAQLVVVFEQLTGVSLTDDPDSELSPFLSATNHLLAWDTPAYPGYPDDKSGIFLLVEPRWSAFFDDPDSAIDWRPVSWGGVLIDDRELGDPAPCPSGCIPALDDPQVTGASGGDWYPDDRIVFGIVVGDDALAIPLHIAETHEMFNLTLGGRRLGVPYCTLCGSAQAYFTDSTATAEQPVLRTSGLLSRSNKVMYDLRTGSVFDTFTGRAVSGPLHHQGVALEQTTVVRSTWGEWKATHPGTAIVARDGGIGREYDLDPLGGRDDDGPIFPVGAVDERLGVHAFVVGVIAPDGTPVAFPADLAGEVLARGDEVELGGVRLSASGDGFVATAADGDELAGHEAFWFAWSQFHPDTILWEG